MNTQRVEGHTPTLKQIREIRTRHMSKSYWQLFKELWAISRK